MPQASLPPDLDALPLEMVALSDLHPHPRNYQEHPPEELAHIRHSLQENGFYRNIVIAEDNTILAGHGVVQAAQQEGYAHIPVRRLPVGPEHPRAMRVLVGDNEMGRLSLRDAPTLAAMLEELRTLGVAELLGTGFDDDRYHDLLRTMSDPSLTLGDPANTPAPPDATPQLAGLLYQVIIACEDEAQQSALLERFTEEGLACRALIS